MLPYKVSQLQKSTLTVRGLPGYQVLPAHILSKARSLWKPPISFVQPRRELAASPPAPEDPGEGLFKMGVSKTRGAYYDMLG